MHEFGNTCVRIVFAVMPLAVSIIRGPRTTLVAISPTARRSEVRELVVAGLTVTEQQYVRDCLGYPPFPFPLTPVTDNDAMPFIPAPLLGVACVGFDTPTWDAADVDDDPDDDGDAWRYLAVSA